MTSTLRVLLLACSLPLAAQAFAAEPAVAPAAASAATAEVSVEGYKFPESHQVFGQKLVLNGAGVSAVFNMKATAVAFYVPKKQTTAAGLLESKGAKRVEFYMLRDISARDLSNSMLDRIRLNASEDFAHNVLQTAELGSVFGARAKVFKGDMVTIDFDPASQSTTFSLNGQKLAEPIKGDTFFPMMMKIWIGPKVRASTRDELLGLARP
jgi:hypothetical protein